MLKFFRFEILIFVFVFLLLTPPVYARGRQDRSLEGASEGEEANNETNVENGETRPIINDIFGSEWEEDDEDSNRPDSDETISGNQSDFFGEMDEIGAEDVPRSEEDLDAILSDMYSEKEDSSQIEKEERNTLSYDNDQKDKDVSEKIEGENPESISKQNENDANEKPVEDDDGSAYNIVDFISGLGFPSKVLLIVLIILTGLSISLIIYIRVLKSKLQEDEQNAPKATSGSLHIKIHVMAGKYIGNNTEFDVNEKGIVIGSGGKCDIVFEDSYVDEKNAMLFMENHMLYLKDLDSSYGTAVGGMRIYGDNPIRNGDEIFVGMSKFMVYF